MSRNIGCFLFEVVTNIEKEIATMFNIVASKPNINGSLFTADYQNKIDYLRNFTIFPINEAKYYYGDMIVWDLLSLDMVHKFPNLKTIYYFQGPNIPWINNAHIPKEMWQSLFCNPKIKMITDNQQIQKIFKDTWNSDLFLLKTMTPEGLYEAIQLPN